MAVEAPDPGHGVGARLGRSYRAGDGDRAGLEVLVVGVAGDRVGCDVVDHSGPVGREASLGDAGGDRDTSGCTGAAAGVLKCGGVGDQGRDLGVSPPCPGQACEDCRLRGGAVVGGGVSDEGTNAAAGLSALADEVGVPVLVAGHAAHDADGGDGDLRACVDEEVAEEREFVDGRACALQCGCGSSGDCRGSAGSVGSPGGSHASGIWVAEWAFVEGRQETAGEVCQLADQLRIGRLVEGDPDVSATGRSGDGDQVFDVELVEPEAESSGVVGGVALAGVEVEAEVDVAVLVGEVHRPRAGGSLARDHCCTGVGVAVGTAVAFEYGGAHAIAGADRAGEFPGQFWVQRHACRKNTLHSPSFDVYVGYANFITPSGHGKTLRSFRLRLEELKPAGRQTHKVRAKTSGRPPSGGLLLLSGWHVQLLLLGAGSLDDGQPAVGG